jgi:hypothetical protein
MDMGMEKVNKEKRGLLNRANVRRLIVVLSATSALAWDVDGIKICLSLSLLAIGSALHFVAKGTLIRNIVLYKDGVYRMVRHPYYLANYLTDSSFCLLSGNGYLLLLYPFLFFWAYGPSLRKEEKWLASTYGDEHLQYSVEIPQVFPDAHSVKNWRSFLRGFSKGRITTRELVRLMRFWAVAFFLILLHDLGKEGLGELIFWSHPKDHDGLVYLVVSICLYFVSFLLVQRVRFRLDLTESDPRFE